MKSLGLKATPLLAIAPVVLTALLSVVALPAASSASCPADYDDAGVRYIHTCDPTGTLQEKRGIFISTGGVSSIDKRISPSERFFEIFSIEGVQTGRTRILTLSPGIERREGINLKTGLTDSAVTLALNERGQTRLLEEEHYKDGLLTYSEKYDALERPTVRKLGPANGNLPQGEIRFTYRTSKGRYDRALKALLFTDKHGKVISDYNEDRYPPGHFGGQLPEAAMILDTGFDLSHPALASHVYRSPDEPFDGIDNDGNGYVDDGSGWNGGTNSNRLGDELMVNTRELLPLSHGTHVASLAFRGIKRFGFVGVSGAVYVNALEYAKSMIDRDKIRFANMSFGWSEADEFMGPGAGSTAALTNLIATSPNTLFIVAAGNSANHLVFGEADCEIPACLFSPNLLRVAAYDASSFKDSHLEQGKMASFASYGVEVADIAAPGVSVPGAIVGGGWLPMSGSSMASPLAMNTLLKMAEINPALSIKQLSEILLKTAYIPDIRKPLPLRSGGIVFPRRAFAVTKETLRSPERSIESIIESVRLHPNMLLKGEDNSPATQALLKDIWRRVDRQR